jgi:hypothetical protein
MKSVRLILRESLRTTKLPEAPDFETLLVFESARLLTNGLSPESVKLGFLLYLARISSDDSSPTQAEFTKMTLTL